MHDRPPAAPLEGTDTPRLHAAPKIEEGRSAT